MADMFGPGFDSLRLHLKASNLTLTGFFIFSSELYHFISNYLKFGFQLPVGILKHKNEPNKNPNWLINWSYLSRIRSLIGSQDV